MILYVEKIADGIWKVYDRVDHTFEFPDDDYFYVNYVRLLILKIYQLHSKDILYIKHQEELLYS